MDKHPKTLWSFHTDRETPPLEVNRYLQRFNHVFAIDTNTIPRAGGSRISVYTAWEGRSDAVTEDWSTFLKKKEPVFWKAARNEQGNPERSAWADFLKHVLSSSGYDDSLRIAIV